MKRFLLDNLKQWKQKPNRKPLIITGARQVGKTWLMKEFGRTCYKKTAYLNFDKNQRLKTAFETSIEPKRLIPILEIESGIRITSDDTLIIFDEIQEVPRALTSLKYFCEDAPEYSIVAAGSQMGIALHQGTNFPVGKVEFLDLYPLNFREFLVANNQESLSELIINHDYDTINIFRDTYLDLLKQYFYIGGMPEAVSSFIQDKDFSKVREIQNSIINYYQQDFSKHAPVNQIPRLNMIWNSIPSQLAKENKKFIYGAVKTGGRAKEFEIALQWLQDCSLVHKVYSVTKPDLPLKFYVNLDSFKIYLNDIGLLCAMSELDVKTIIEGSRIFEEFKGALTEQFVLQQLISDEKVTPYYFVESVSRSEIDFIIQKENQVIPIEVKAGENLQAKSLKFFHQKYQNEVSIRTSLSNYRHDDWLTNIPLWAIGTLHPSNDANP